MGFLRSQANLIRVGPAYTRRAPVRTASQSVTPISSRKTLPLQVKILGKSDHFE